MPIDRQHSRDYQEGAQAFNTGLDIADKPAMMLRGEWEAGWHDAMAKVVRELAKAK
jgi:ribosome modulation factor